MRTGGVCALVRSGNTVRTNVEVVNLSLGGAFVRTFELFPMGAQVHLDLEWRGLKRSIHVSGEIVAVRNKYEAGAQRLGPGMGIRFAPLGEEAKRQLEALLSRLAPGRRVLDGDAPEDGPELPVEWCEPAADAMRAAAPVGELELTFPEESAGEAAQFELVEHGVAVSPNFRAAVPIATLADESGALALEVSRLRRELEERDTRQRTLEAENQRLLDDLTQVRGALTPVPKL